MSDEDFFKDFSPPAKAPTQRRRAPPPPPKASGGSSRVMAPNGAPRAPSFQSRGTAGNVANQRSASSSVAARSNGAMKSESSISTARSTASTSIRRPARPTGNYYGTTGTTAATTGGQSTASLRTSGTSQQPKAPSFYGSSTASDSEWFSESNDNNNNTSASGTSTVAPAPAFQSSQAFQQPGSFSYPQQQQQQQHQPYQHQQQQPYASHQFQQQQQPAVFQPQPHQQTQFQHQPEPDTLGLSGDMDGGGSTNKAHVFVPKMSQQNTTSTTTYDFSHEPPLLEELGVNLEHIWLKTRAVAVPSKRWTHNEALMDPQLIVSDADMVGPLALALLLGGEMLLSGKLQFGYIYGFGLFGCVAMTLILNLMSPEAVSAWTVTSVLGYALLPVNILALLKIVLVNMIHLTTLARILAILTVLWSTVASTRLLEVGCNLRPQRYLIAYPIALLYSAFVLITIF